MDRLKNLVLGSAHAFDDNESLVSNDYNWNDISIGNDTIGCEKFFRKYSFCVCLFACIWQLFFIEERQIITIH